MSASASTPRATPVLPRYFFVVARNRPDILGRVRERLGADPRIEIVVDRRHGERRTSTAPTAHDRRRADRRRPRKFWDDLTVHPTLVTTKGVEPHGEREQTAAADLQQTVAAELNQTAATELQPTAAAASSESQELRTENGRLCDEIGRLRDDNGRLHDDNGRLRDQVADLQGRLATLSSANDELCSENRDLRAQIASLQSRIDGLAAADTDLRAAAVRLCDQIASLQSWLSTLTQRLTSNSKASGRAPS